MLYFVEGAYEMIFLIKVYEQLMADKEGRVKNNTNVYSTLGVFDNKFVETKNCLVKSIKLSTRTLLYLAWFEPNNKVISSPFDPVKVQNVGESVFLFEFQILLNPCLGHCSLKRTDIACLGILETNCCHYWCIWCI